MRKTCGILSLLVLILLLCACGNTENTDNNITDVIQTPVPTAEPTPDPYEDIINEHMIHDGTGIYYRDLDGNGIEELFLGSTSGNIYENQVITAMYTVSDGQAKQVLESSDKSKFYMTENGTIAQEDFAKTIEKKYSYYTYANGELILMFGVGFDAKADEENAWYRFDNEGSSVMSEIDAMNMVIDYENSYQNLPYIR